MKCPDATEAYLETAKAADLLHTLHELPYVAGLCSDPVSGERQCLAEYCHPDLLRNEDWCCELAARLADGFPDADLIIARSRDGQDLARPWRKLVTYLYYDGEPVMGGDQRDSAVVISTPGLAHMGLVRQWLARALRAGYDSQERFADADGVRGAADVILGDEHRRSYLALAEGQPVGHLTLLTNAYDDITGTEYFDLVDMLVEPGEYAASARRELISAAAADAAAAGMRLIGNVTHASASADADDGQRVVDSLLSRGWRVGQTDWQWCGS